MADSIYAFLERRENKEIIDKLVDQTDYLLRQPTTDIELVIPATSYASRSLLINRFKGHRPLVGTLIAEDQSIPPSRPQMLLSEELLTNTKIGKGYEWNEMDQRLLLELQSSTMQAATKTAIEQNFFGNVASIVPGLYDKSLILAMQVAISGVCNFVDPISGVNFAVDYTGAIPTAHLPAALTTTNKWDAPLTCTPLTIIKNLTEQVYRRSSDPIGEWAPYIFMHWEQLRQIAESNEAKIAFVRSQGNSTTGTPDLTGVYLDDDTAKGLVTKFGHGVQVKLFDTKYSELQADKRTVLNKPFLADTAGNTGYIFLAFESYIERAFVPTIEAKLSPGVYLVNGFQTDRVPHRYWTEGVANFIPFVADPRRIAAQKVV